MSLVTDLLAAAPDGRIISVTIGLHWTAVVAEVEGGRRCGLAATLRGAGGGHDGPDVPGAGQLEALSGRELAVLARSGGPVQRSLGFAALNALLPPQPDAWFDANAEEVIAACGAGRTVALIGHFPFVDRLRSQVGALHVLELDPRGDDLPAGAAPEVLPGAEVVAITGMTLLNDTLEGLLALCSPAATVLLLGPSTPLHPILFGYGVDLLSGAVVEDIDAVVRHVRQGANFRQVHRAGVRLVTMAATPTDDKGLGRQRRPGWG